MKRSKFLLPHIKNKCVSGIYLKAFSYKNAVREAVDKGCTIYNNHAIIEFNNDKYVVSTVDVNPVDVVYQTPIEFDVYGVAFDYFHSMQESN